MLTPEGLEGFFLSLQSSLPNHKWHTNLHKNLLMWDTLTFEVLCGRS